MSHRTLSAKSILRVADDAVPGGGGINHRMQSNPLEAAEATNGAAGKRLALIARWLDRCAAA